MTHVTRRTLLSSLSAPVVGTVAGSWTLPSRADAADKVLTIAYPAAPSAFDPNTGPQAVSPGIQSIYRTLFDPYIVQKGDLSLAPGVMKEYGWNKEKTRISLTLRDGVKWHDGEPLTMDDVVWNLRRLTDPKAPLAPVFASNKDFVIDGNTLSFEVSPWRANMLERLTFLGSYLIPQKYYEKVGAEGFEKQPIGSGPYAFDRFERGSFLRLKPFGDYWGSKPAFSTVIFKFVTDAPTRVAEVESGSSDVAVDIPFEQYDRLRKNEELTGSCYPIADVALIFFNNIGPFSDENVRKAAVYAVDKKAIVDRLLRGYGKALGTLLVPEYKGYDASIFTPYDPKAAVELLAKSGFSTKSPVELTIQTTRGYKPKDYETVEAIVQMWRRVGINANIEVYEIAKHFELRAQHKLAPAAFYDWGNSTADPESSLGTSMIANSPHSSWKGGEEDAALKALFVEKDDAKRLEGYRKLDMDIAEHAYILPLFQYFLPVVYKKDLAFDAHAAGYVMPSLFKTS